MRKLIAGMKISVDGKMEGPEGYADWVEAWSEDYGLTQQIDACVLGGRMYPGYEQYWTTIQNEPEKPHPLSNRIPTKREVEWARFIQRTPHYVLSSTVTSALWPKTSFIRGLEDMFRAQAATRQGYLSHGRGSDYDEPHRCRAGR
jgi:hypothetical protein